MSQKQTGGFEDYGEKLNQIETTIDSWESEFSSNLVTGEFVPANPAELATPFINLIDDRCWERNPTEYEVISELDRLASGAAMETLYFTQAGRAMSIPIEFDSDKDVTYGLFDGLSFEGLFRNYSYVKIGELIGLRSIRALCLTFDNVLLLPFVEPLEEDHLLHVPALAIDYMSKVA